MPGKESLVPKESLNGKYDYDLIVIGGGSGGLAASKAAVKEKPGLKVAVFDYVKPSPGGTQWGLGGTCVNVGCIPKKLFHYSSHFHEEFGNARALGWKIKEEHSWKNMVRSVNGYIKSINFNYKKELKEATIDYINALASFTDDHTVTYTEGGEEKKISAENFMVVVGGRPTIPKIEGAEYAINSDDIFWMKNAPGKTLLVGASYIALECGGFINSLGYDTTICVRSILLRGYDKQCAAQVGEAMERAGVKFIQPATVTKLEKKSGEEGKITATFMNRETKEETTDEFDTVLYAIGRDPDTPAMGLAEIGVKLGDGKNGEWNKVLVDEGERSSVPHIYAFGDCASGRPTLTPAAIAAGQRLAKRLYGGSTRLMDYTHVPTTIFTPIEFGTVGLSTEDAEKKLGADGVITYLTRYGALESAVSDKELVETKSECFHGMSMWARQHAQKHKKQYWEKLDKLEKGSYNWGEEELKFMKQPMLAKLVCEKGSEKVIGFHYVGPNAGEVLQGFALAVKLGATKEDFDELVGIHPTCAEEFTTLPKKPTLESGEDFMKQGGC